MLFRRNQFHHWLQITSSWKGLKMELGSHQRAPPRLPKCRMGSPKVKCLTLNIIERWHHSYGRQRSLNLTSILWRDINLHGSMVWIGVGKVLNTFWRIVIDTFLKYELEHRVQNSFAGSFDSDLGEWDHQPICNVPRFCLADIVGKAFSLHSIFSLHCLTMGSSACAGQIPVWGVVSLWGAQRALQKGKEQKIGHKAGQNCSRRP